MKKTLLLKLPLIVILMALTTSVSYTQVRITEAMSSSGSGGTNDWIELTNLGTIAVDITGWKMDDSSYAVANAVAFVGVTSIPAGKSVIFLETDDPTTDVAAFKTFWGTSLDAISIGSYPSSGKGVGLSGNGDGVIIFDASDIEITRVTVPVATTGSSFYWVYKTDNTVETNGAVSVTGTITGGTANQITIKSTNALGNIGSPGTAVVGGLSANVDNPTYSSGWKLVGSTLHFSQIPQNNVQIFSISGNKVAELQPEKEIALNLPKGIYIIRVDNHNGKILLP
ncbi:MAG: lamin tail domain-containing protein [Paludibacteraceae bacterium]